MQSTATSMLRSMAGQMPSISRNAWKLLSDSVAGQNGLGQAYTVAAPPIPPSATR